MFQCSVVLKAVVMKFDFLSLIFLIIFAISFDFLAVQVFCTPQSDTRGFRVTQRIRFTVNRSGLIPMWFRPQIFLPGRNVPQFNRPSRNRCEDHFTFFDGKCLHIGPGSFEHCPKNMELFDGPNNEGFCDCVDYPGHPLFYSQENGECVEHNTQGPCLDGEWYVLKNGSPQCEPVPEGCLADGKHFYGSPDETMPKQCWELGSNGHNPCGPDESLNIGHVEANAQELTIICIPSNFVSSSAPSSIGSQLSCRPGTLRNRLRECKHGFIG